MTTAAQETIFDVVFTQQEHDRAYNTDWHRAIRSAFPSDRQPEFRIEARMTAREFEAMTGVTDVEAQIGYVVEHYDGPGIFDIDMASHEYEGLWDAINRVENDKWEPIDPDELTAEGVQALVHVMKQTLDLDWKVQSELVDGDFVDRHMDEIKLFMRPAGDDDC